MRQLEKDMIKAIQARKTWKKGNTRTWQADRETTAIFLHDIPIALYAHDTNKVFVHLDILAEWPTRTTCSRLRALGVPVSLKKGKPLIEGEPLYRVANNSGVYNVPASFA